MLASCNDKPTTSRPAAAARVVSTAAITGNAQAPGVAAIATPTYLTYSQADYYWTQNPQLFMSLWQTAKTQTVRVALLGDSQETNPGGAGSVYVPRVNYELWRRFGNVPETPIQGCSFYGGGAPFADWLLRGACATPGPSPTRLAANQILPGLQPHSFSTLNGAGNTNGEYLGQLTMLQQNAIDIDPAAEVPTTNNYFNPSGVVKAEVFAATNPTSGEIAYWALPTNSNVPSYYSATTAAGTLTLGLQSSTFAVKSGRTAALPFNSNTYMAVQLAGTDDSKLTDILGVRFVNESHPEGVVVDTFSQGGYQATNFLSNHGNAGALFQALNFQVVILHYGANDSGNGVTAQDFKANITAVIALVRGWTGNPNLPVILAADPYRNGLTSAQQTEFDQYVGAQIAIAQADSNVLVINSRRLMDALGWNGTSGQSATFLKDGVHDTPYGAQALAAAEVSAVMGEVHLSGCATDQGNVTLQPSMTLTLNLGGIAPCTGYDQYNVAQLLTLNKPTLNVVLANGFVPAYGQAFRILSAGSIAGTFGSLTLPTLPAGLAWNTAGLYTNGMLSISSSSAAGGAQSSGDAPIPLWALGILGAGIVGAARRRLSQGTAT